MRGDELRIELTDHGRPFEPDMVSRPDPEAPQVGGYGLMIIEQVAEELSYSRVDEKNVWDARFLLDS